MIVRPYGDRAVLVETDDVLALVAAVSGRPGVEEVVPAARTVLIRIDPTVFDLAGLDDLAAVAGPALSGELVELPVRYDGADLELVATTAGCSMAAVIARHCEPVYTVAFCGFSPGFAYLSGLAESLLQPRLDTPRTIVPSGSVGIAGAFTGVYPRASPGGWRLLGHTDAVLWDLERNPPALLAPGTRVRFVPT